VEGGRERAKEVEEGGNRMKIEEGGKEERREDEQRGTRTRDKG
jgi:hypothetical protein